MEHGTYPTRFDELSLDSPSNFYQETTSDTDNHRYYDWGHCWIVGGTVSDPRAGCTHNKAKMTYYVYAQKGSGKGKRECRGDGLNATSIQNKICKEDTGAASGRVGGDFLYWTYQ